MTLLEAENLQTSFYTDRGEVRAVNGVDMSVRDNEIVGIVGESGSGKTVLGNSIMRIEEPGEIKGGTLSFDGESLLDKTDEELRKVRGGKIGMVFQDPSKGLNPVISVGEQVAETVRLHQEDISESVTLSAEVKRKLLGVSKNTETWHRVVQLLEDVAIPEPRKRSVDFPHQFSGGMKQRVMIAIALAGKPDLLVADEPTTGLDVTTQANLLEELAEIKEQFDMSIIYITHDLPSVAELCDRVNVMYAGEIVERASAQELFENPQHPYTQGLLKSIPRVTGVQEDLNPIQGTVPELIDIPYECHFAPRCPEATDDCYNHKPEFKDVGDSNHEAACHYRGPEHLQL